MPLWLVPISGPVISRVIEATEGLLEQRTSSRSRVGGACHLPGADRVGVVLARRALAQQSPDIGLGFQEEDRGLDVVADPYGIAGEVGAVEAGRSVEAAAAVLGRLLTKNPSNTSAPAWTALM